MSDVVAPENDLTTTLLDAEIFHPRTFCTMLSPQITVTGFLSALVEWCSLVEVSSDGLGELKSIRLYSYKNSTKSLQIFSEYCPTQRQSITYVSFVYD